MDDLISRVHGLPPELFEKIYFLTFTATPAPGFVWMSRHAKKPHLLQVDRASRALYASSLYANPDIAYIMASEREVKRLFKLGPAEHMDLLQVVYIWIETSRDCHDCDSVPGWQCDHCRLHMVEDLCEATEMLLDDIGLPPHAKIYGLTVTDEGGDFTAVAFDSDEKVTERRMLRLDEDRAFLEYWACVRL